MKLRTFDGERVKGELTTDHHLSEDGVPVLVVGGEAYLPDEEDFFIELATDEHVSFCFNFTLVLDSPGDIARQTYTPHL